jgi:hypothetical protein
MIVLRLRHIANWPAGEYRIPCQGCPPSLMLALAVAFAKKRRSHNGDFLLARRAAYHRDLTIGRIRLEAMTSAQLRHGIVNHRSPDRSNGVSWLIDEMPEP